jgi:hypothetical protein
MAGVGHGRKRPDATVGAPFAPATDHIDGPERPRRDVPTANGTADQQAGDETEAEPEDEEEESR